MSLHGMRVPRLREDFQQLIIGQEVEPGEGRSFCFKIVLKTLLNVIKGFVVYLELSQQFF